MFMFAGKFLLWLLILFIYLTNIITVLLAQPDFRVYTCENAANYTTNSTYRRSLDTTLATLPTTDSGFGFFNYSTGQGNNSAKSIALCRGDVEPNLCRSCLNDSIVKLRELCPNQMEAAGYYDNCLLKYSNQNMLANPDVSYDWIMWNTNNASDRDRFNAALRPLLSNLVDTAAAGGSLRKFAAGNTSGPDLSSIYGLVQCTPNLGEQECTTCLESGISQFSSGYSGRLGGRALGPMCNFRYESYSFYNDSNLVIPPPPSSSPPPGPPSPGWLPPPPSPPPASSPPPDHMTRDVSAPHPKISMILLKALDPYQQPTAITSQKEVKKTICLNKKSI